MDYVPEVSSSVTARVSPLSGGGPITMSNSVAVGLRKNPVVRGRGRLGDIQLVGFDHRAIPDAVYTGMRWVSTYSKDTDGERFSGTCPVEESPVIFREAVLRLMQTAPVVRLRESDSDARHTFNLVDVLDDGTVIHAKTIFSWSMILDIASQFGKPVRVPGAHTREGGSVRLGVTYRPGEFLTVWVMDFAFDTSSGYNREHIFEQKVVGAELEMGAAHWTLLENAETLLDTLQSERGGCAE